MRIGVPVLAIAVLGHLLLAQSAMSTVDVGGDITQLIGNGSNFYVTLSTSKEVVAVSPGGAILARIAIPDYGGEMAVDPSGPNLYVALQNLRDVAVINTVTNSMTQIIDLTYDDFGAMAGLVVGRPGRLYVVVSRDIVSIVDTVSRTEVSTFSAFALGADMYGASLAMSPDKRILYFSTMGVSPGSIYAYDVTTDTPIYAGEDCCHGCISGGTIFVSAAGDKLYTLWDGILNSVPLFHKDTMLLADSHYGLWISEATGRAFISSGFSQPTVTYVDLNTFLPYHQEILEHHAGINNLALIGGTLAVATGDSSSSRHYLEFLSAGSGGNRGGVKFRPVDADTGLPIWVYPQGCYLPDGYSSGSGFLDYKAGVFACGPLAPGNKTFNFYPGGYNPVTRTFTVTSGAWTDLGTITFTRTNPITYEATATCAVPGLHPGDTGNVLIHGSNFLPSLTVTSFDSRVTVNSYSYTDWATVNANITVASNVLPGTDSNVLRVNNAGDNSPIAADIAILPVPMPTISIDNVSIVEGNSGLTPVTVTLSIEPANSVASTVQFTTADGTALAGSDYVTSAGTLDIPANATSATLTVDVVGETAMEPDEFFVMNLSNATAGTVIGDGQGVVTILDDDCPPLGVAPASLPDGAMGVPYSQSLSGSGGTAPYVFSLASGSLPAGITLSGAGVISGTPTKAGTFPLNVGVVDANSCQNTQPYTLTIMCTAALDIAPITVPDTVQGAAYTVQFSGVGGTGPYTFTLSGALPQGLTLSTAGLLSGTATGVGPFNFTISATDANGCTGSRTYSMTVSGCLFCDDFTGTVLPSGWNFLKGIWNEGGGNLVGNAARKGIAVATPVFSGCTLCRVETDMQSAGGVGSRVWLLAFYKDKYNYLEVMMKDDVDKWLLKQHVGGAVRAKAKALSSISPGINYNVKVFYDGSAFRLYVDNVLLITLPAVGSPFGTVGFQTKATIATFGKIYVY